ncbi:MAG: hypothetical protein ACRC2T_08345, partial [Thermoguttaceae bacterium]
GKFVVRKEITSLTSTEIFKIRDERIKELVLTRFAQHNVDQTKIKQIKEKEFKKIQKEAFAEPLYLTPEKERKDGKTRHTVIKKVRILVEDQTIQQVKANQKDAPFVKPGSNHHICLFEYIDQKTGEPKRESIFTSRLEANRRLAEQQRLIKAKRLELQTQGLTEERRKEELQEYRKMVVSQIEPVIRKTHPDRPNAKFLFSLKRGDMFRVLDKGIEKLVIFKTAPSTTKNFCFIEIRDARKEATKINKSGASYLDILEKVQVDRIGGITAAND